MVANGNLAPQAGKYARFELERKFLLDRLPDGLGDDSRLYDRYIAGTRLRLRRAELPGGTIQYKLNQKESPSPPDYGVMTITSIYLTAASTTSWPSFPLTSCASAATGSGATRSTSSRAPASTTSSSTRRGAART